MTFELRWEHHPIGDAARVIEVHGPLLFPDSRLLGQELTHVVRTGTRQLVLDLTEVTDIDSALVGLLVACARQVGWRGGHVAVVSDDEQMLSMLATTGLDSIVEVARTPAQALSHLGVTGPDARAAGRR
jgi:anti-anti-sigma factor